MSPKKRPASVTPKSGAKVGKKRRQVRIQPKMEMVEPESQRIVSNMEVMTDFANDDIGPDEQLEKQEATNEEEERQREEANLKIVESHLEKTNMDEETELYMKSCWSSKMVSRCSWGQQIQERRRRINQKEKEKQKKQQKQRPPLGPS